MGAVETRRCFVHGKRNRVQYRTCVHIVMCWVLACRCMYVRMFAGMVKLEGQSTYFFDQIDMIATSNNYYHELAY